MAQGRFERTPSRKRRKLNPGFIITILTVLVLVLMIVAAVLLIRSCAAKPEVPTEPSAAQTEPETQPAVSTEPTAEATEETTQETTEATEETTEATEETTEATEETTEATEETTEATQEPTAPAEPSAFGDKVAELAKAQEGKPYAYGGNGPEKFDVSGLISYCFRENGVDVPRLLSGQSAHGTKVEKEDLQPGDVVFFWSENPGEVEYGGIYIGGGQFVAARNPEHPVSIMGLNTAYFSERFICARRFG